MYWNKVGPFHGFPLLPLAEKECLLGQLTYKYVCILTEVNWEIIVFEFVVQG